MVRLKENEPKKENGKVTLFQFHYGTIKSMVALFHGIFLFNFNSTMVRLKDENDSTGID